MTAAVKQAEFARLIGVERSYVTALKKSGRLVLDAAGLVLVEASKKRIAETADPNRDDVKLRWQQQRQEPEAAAAPVVDHDFQQSRAKKEHYQAEQARIEYERSIGKLIERQHVDAAIADVVTTLRHALENLPHRAAADLVGKDLDAIRALLKQEVHGALVELERAFGERMREMTEAE